MDELLYRQMPHSLEAEQAVLGSMLIDANCIKDVMEKLRPEDFYLRQNREIFETIYQMFVYSKPIDGVTVAGELEKAGLYTDTTRSYLVQLMEVTPTSANVMEYVRIVQDKSLMRQVAQAAGSITAMVQEGGGAAGDMLEAAEQQIYAIRRGRSGQGMVTVFVRQRLPGGKLIDDGVERIQIKAAFGSELEVFLEAVGKNDIKHPRVPHSWHPEKKRSAYTFLGVLSSRHTRSARLPFLHWDSPE